MYKSDRRKLDDLTKKMLVKKVGVQVGVIDELAEKFVDPKGKSTLLMGELANMQEHGFLTKLPNSSKTVHVPARSFIREPLSTSNTEWLLKRAAKAYFDFVPLKDIKASMALHSISLVHAAFMTSGGKKWAPISPMTRARRLKRGNDGILPLVDTRRLLESLDWRDAD